MPDEPVAPAAEPSPSAAQSAPAPKEEAKGSSAEAAPSPTSKEDSKTPSSEAAPSSAPHAENKFQSAPAKDAPANAKADAKPNIIPQQAQRSNRAENQDFMRVLQQYITQGLPVVINTYNIGQDAVFHAPGGPQTNARVLPTNRDSAEVTADEIQRVRRVYQRHSAYAEALHALRKDRVVVLRGQANAGKRAMAIRLAQEVWAEQKRAPAQPTLWMLAAEEDLMAQLAPEALRRSAFFLVDNWLREPGRGLKHSDVEALRGRLKECNGYLILCALPSVAFPNALSWVMVEPLAMPAALLLRAHLEYYGPFDEAQIQAALGDDAIRAALKQDLTPAQVNQLAEHLARAMQDGRPLTEALAGFTAAAESEVREWFDETIAKNNSRASALRLALAVFHGARYLTVMEAARDLERRLKPPPPPSAKAEPPPAPSPFASKTSFDLAGARAKKVPRQIVTEYSDHATVEVVELENLAYSTALLKYVWEEFDDLRPTLLSWLSDHALRGPYDMRLRAAGALGALAGLDFNFLRAEVFRPWAMVNTEDNDVRREYYRALGNALGVLIWNDERADDVLGLLRDWSKSTNDEHLRWAAARAYAQVGLRYPREAINQWRRILETKAKLVIQLTDTFGLRVPHPLHMSVVDAVVTLFLRAVELPHRLRPVYEQALEGLAAWVEADVKDRNAEQAGLPLFLALTSIQLPPEDGSGEPEDWPPAMLFIIGTQPDSSYRRALASLLLHAIKHAELKTLAAEALRFWTMAAERDARLAETLEALLRDMLALPNVTHNRERDFLKMHLTRWFTLPAHKNPKAPKPIALAGALLAKLGLTT